MIARRLVLATVVSLCSLVACVLLAASTALAEELCPNAASRQGPSSALPDCRAYEQVTPVDKEDATDLFPSNGINEVHNGQGFAAEDGNRFVFQTNSSFAGGDAIESTYIFTRGADGWTTTSLSPGAGVHRLNLAVFDPKSLSEVGFEDRSFYRAAGQQETHTVSEDVGAPGGPYTSVATGPADVPGLGERSMVAASTDLSQIVLETKDHELAPGATGQVEGTTALYETSGGHLKLVNVYTNGSLISPCGATLGNGESETNAHNAVADDGTKIIFTAPEPRWCEAPPELYMRIDGTSTVEISAPNRNGNKLEAPQPAYYVGASADGTKVFFLSNAELTADDATHAVELYEYDTEAPEGQRLARVSSGESGAAEGAAEFVPAISSDGSTVYFTAYGKLATGASTLVEKEGGMVNLYRYDTATKRTTYITQVGNAEYPMTGDVTTGSAWYPSASKYLALTLDADWETTANGQYLLFDSAQRLTGYDNEYNPALYDPGAGRSCANQVYQSEPGNRCGELFRYSAADNSIVCVSCAGSAPTLSDSPTEDARFTRSELERPDVPPLHAISEDGSYVFFETTSALVPQAGNSTLHVYEWHDGKISLISSPGDSGNALFLGATPDGSNVFFGTHAQLSPQDMDAGGDLYDARIDGGFAGLAPSVCTGTGCQGIPAAPPIFATPASATFEGVGNFGPPLAVVKPKPKAKPAKCKKGFVRKRGKCVKAKAKKKAKKSNRRGK